MSIKERRKFDDTTKQTLVELYMAGHDVSELLEQKEIKRAHFLKWVRAYKNNGSLKPTSQLSPEQIEINRLKKLLKEKDQAIEILKHAALILAEKKK